MYYRSGILKSINLLAGAYFLECKNDKYSKNIQTFYNLEEYTRSLYIMNWNIFKT